MEKFRTIKGYKSIGLALYWIYVRVGILFVNCEQPVLRRGYTSLLTNVVKQSSMKK